MRVVLAEDNALLRGGVAAMLRDNGFEVVASVGDAAELLEAVAGRHPELAIVDVRMPPTHTDEGLRAAIEIRRTYTDTAVLVFSQWVEMTYARELLSGRTEKMGYLLKDRVVDVSQFIEAARRVARGGTAVDPEVVRQLLARPAPDSGLAQLSDREGAVLARLAEGKSNQAIADELFLAIRSVEKNVASIFLRLGLPPAVADHRRVLAVLRYLNSPD